MIKTWSLIFCLIFGLDVHCQTIYFNKVYDFYGGTEYSVSIVPTPSGFLINAGGHDSTGWEKLAYLQIDSTGNELHKKVYPIPKSFVRNGRMISLYNGKYADWRTIQQSDTAGEFDSWPLLSMVTKEGDTLFTRAYSDSTARNNYSFPIFQTPDSGFFLVYQRDRHPDYDPVIIKTDSLGNEQWRKIIDTPGRDYLYTVVRHPNGKYYFGGGGTPEGFNPG